MSLSTPCDADTVGMYTNYDTINQQDTLDLRGIIAHAIEDMHGNPKRHKHAQTGQSGKQPWAVKLKH